MLVFKLLAADSSIRLERRSHKPRVPGSSPGQPTNINKNHKESKMEHILHFFGGGCGEHLLLPALVSGASGTWLSVRYYFAKCKKEDPNDSSTI